MWSHLRSQPMHNYVVKRVRLNSKLARIFTSNAHDFMFSVLAWISALSTFGQPTQRIVPIDENWNKTKQNQTSITKLIWRPVTIYTVPSIAPYPTRFSFLFFGWWEQFCMRTCTHTKHTLSAAPCALWRLCWWWWGGHTDWHTKRTWT